jgi:undecaprenyl-diphosphatase
LKNKNRYLKIFTIEFIAASCIFLLSVLLFSIIANEVVVENENNFDYKVFRVIASYTSPFKTKVALFITFFGTGYFLIPAYILTILYYARQKMNGQAIVVGIVAVISLLSGWAFKDIFHRPRPLLPLISGAGGYSFPSGHSLGGFTFSGVIIYLLWRTTIPKYLKWTLSILLVLFAFLIGLSRIYLRVHFASDVMGSLLLTLVWLSISFIFLKAFENRSKRRNAELANERKMFLL